ncbi:MAG: iron-sulfur cluster assembly scaffold protein [Gammaproteobacteria bacterium]|jgi:nitrogen fixation NifU-like protein|nr:iron-sulfur cluster assembly scaffold protein [Gammaproteobacteria bacterium]|tara:strand:- start:112 stop:555 length:444 start_codon:yes stop_codon:yes gene_type:complete
MNIELQDLYQKTMIQHGNNPLNFGKPQEYEHTEEGFNALCGDKINIYFSNIDNKEVNFSFVSVGCIICKASGSLMTKELNKKDLENIEASIDNAMIGINKGNLKDDFFSNELMTLNQIKNFPSRLKCALLPWETAMRLLNNMDNNAR